MPASSHSTCLAIDPEAVLCSAPSVYTDTDIYIVAGVAGGAAIVVAVVVMWIICKRRMRKAIRNASYSANIVDYNDGDSTGRAGDEDPLLGAL